MHQDLDETAGHLRRENPTVGAFTLVELLVVLGIIGMLAALLLPALSEAKQHAKTVICLNNQNQLAKVWMIYCGDNNDVLVADGKNETPTPFHFGFKEHLLIPLMTT